MSATDKQIVKFLIDTLFEDCLTNGYIGVEYDNLQTDNEVTTLTESLFHKIMIELNVLSSNSQYYIKGELDDDEYDFEPPFKNKKELRNHMIKLSNFVRMYAPLYLPEDIAYDFVEESVDSINYLN